MKRPIVISGFMATGKTTVGALVAERLGVPFVDTDDVLAKTTGTSIPDLFAKGGEGKFRELEAALVMPMLADSTPRVIAFGGGTATIRRVRHAALEATSFVSLEATGSTVAKRITLPGDRPNLDVGDPGARAGDLLALRKEVYGECHARIDTDRRTASEVADLVIAASARDTLAMPLGSRSYAVELGDGIPGRLAATLDEMSPSSVFVVTDDNVRAARGTWLDQALGRPAHILSFVPGEASKTIHTVSRLWDEALAKGLDRNAVVVAFGGGVVGDLAGFVASTLLRGVRCVQVATTLLSMVDSSVGGKTGFDHATGKNLIGAFFQPNHVLVDLAHLETLSARERSAGLAEIVKIALVRDEGLLDALEADAPRLRSGDRTALLPIVRRAVLAKIRVVRDDELETGVRALLNLGHTVGHALESADGYTHLLHGEGVAIGTVLELRACERMNLTPSGLAERAEALFANLGLPTTATQSEVEAAWRFVMSDKKRAGACVRLPIVTKAGAGRIELIPLDAFRTALLA